MTYIKRRDNNIASEILQIGGWGVEVLNVDKFIKKINFNCLNGIDIALQSSIARGVFSPDNVYQIREFQSWKKVAPKFRLWDFFSIGYLG